MRAARTLARVRAGRRGPAWRDPTSLFAWGLGESCAVSFLPCLLGCGWRRGATDDVRMQDWRLLLGRNVILTVLPLLEHVRLVGQIRS
jgi:hypothetical protein